MADRNPAIKTADQLKGGLLRRQIGKTIVLVVNEKVRHCLIELLHVIRAWEKSLPHMRAPLEIENLSTLREHLLTTELIIKEVICMRS